MRGNDWALMLALIQGNTPRCKAGRSKEGWSSGHRTCTGQGKGFLWGIGFRIGVISPLSPQLINRVTSPTLRSRFRGSGNFS